METAVEASGLGKVETDKKKKDKKEKKAKRNAAATSGASMAVVSGVSSAETELRHKVLRLEKKVEFLEGKTDGIIVSIEGLTKKIFETLSTDITAQLKKDLKIAPSSNALTHDQLKEQLDQFSISLSKGMSQIVKDCLIKPSGKIDSLKSSIEPVVVDAISTSVENGYDWGGHIHPIPEQYRFLRGNIYSLFDSWYYSSTYVYTKADGTTQNFSIPPLYLLRGSDLKEGTDRPLLSKARFVMETLFGNDMSIVLPKMNELDFAAKNTLLEDTLKEHFGEEMKTSNTYATVYDVLKNIAEKKKKKKNAAAVDGSSGGGVIDLVGANNGVIDMVDGNNGAVPATSPKLANPKTIKTTNAFPATTSGGELEQIAQVPVIEIVEGNERKRNVSSLGKSSTKASKLSKVVDNNVLADDANDIFATNN